MRESWRGAYHILDHQSIKFGKRETEGEEGDREGEGDRERERKRKISDRSE